MSRPPLVLVALLLCASFAAAQASFNSTSYGVSSSTSGAVSGDFNRDGKPDMAVLSGQSAADSFVTVFLATTPGHFPSGGTSYAVHAAPQDVRAADVNNDGNLDLIVSFANSPVLSILYGHSNGSFTAGSDVTFSGNIGVHGFDIGDFNGDRNLDIAAIECNSSNLCDLLVKTGSGNGTFADGSKVQMTGVARSLSAYDLNGNGALDLILIRTNDVLIFMGDGVGFSVEYRFRVPAHCTDSTVCTDSLESVVVADFNNDQSLDFAVLQAHNCGPGCGSNDVYIYKNDGSLTPTWTRTFDLPVGPSAGGQLFAADLNGDGNYDLVNANGSAVGGGNVYMQGAGNGTFTVKSNNIPSGTAQLVARDLDLDSRHDILDTVSATNSVSVGLNAGGFTNCPPPSSATIAARICAPKTGTTAGSPVLITASGNSPAGIVRLEVWVDGVTKYHRWNDQLAKRLTLTSGTHRVAVVAVDKYQGYASTAVTINVP